MRVLFLWNGLTHYFNLITNKINSQEGVEVIYVYPKERSPEVGEGVFHTKEGADFQLIELEEKVNDEVGTFYDGLETLLRELKPDIIMLSEIHIKSLMFESSLKKIIEDRNIKIVLKSIPFQLEKYERRVDQINSKIKSLPLPPFQSMPLLIRKVLKWLNFDILYKKVILDKKTFRQNVKWLNLQKDIFNFPHAHVNYVEDAYEIYESYGVSRKKIFITYNSPDTDFYFSVKTKIEKEPSILPVNKFRIIHLSRLVKWKRVDMLITAVASLRKEFPEMELLVVGEGPERENLIEQAKSLISLGMNLKSLRNIYFYTGLLIVFFGIICGLILGTAICYLQINTGMFKAGANTDLAFPVKVTLLNYVIVTATAGIFGIAVARIFSKVNKRHFKLM